MALNSKNLSILLNLLSGHLDILVLSKRSDRLVRLKIFCRFLFLTLKLEKENFRFAPNTNFAELEAKFLTLSSQKDFFSLAEDLSLEVKNFCDGLQKKEIGHVLSNQVFLSLWSFDFHQNLEVTHSLGSLKEIRGRLKKETEIVIKELDHGDQSTLPDVLKRYNEKLTTFFKLFFAESIKVEDKVFQYSIFSSGGFRGSSENAVLETLLKKLEKIVKSGNLPANSKTSFLALYCNLFQKLVISDLSIRETEKIILTALCEKSSKNSSAVDEFLNTFGLKKTLFSKTESFLTANKLKSNLEFWAVLQNQSWYGKFQQFLKDYDVENRTEFSKTLALLPFPERLSASISVYFLPFFVESNGDVFNIFTQDLMKGPTFPVFHGLPLKTTLELLLDYFRSKLLLAYPGKANSQMKRLENLDFIFGSTNSDRKLKSSFFYPNFQSWAGFGFVTYHRIPIEFCQKLKKFRVNRKNSVFQKTQQGKRLYGFLRNFLFQQNELFSQKKFHFPSTGSKKKPYFLIVPEFTLFLVLPSLSHLNVFLNRLEIEFPFFNQLDTQRFDSVPNHGSQESRISFVAHFLKNFYLKFFSILEKKKRPIFLKTAGSYEDLLNSLPIQFVVGDRFSRFFSLHSKKTKVFENELLVLTLKQLCFLLTLFQNQLKTKDPEFHKIQSTVEQLRKWERTLVNLQKDVDLQKVTNKTKKQVENITILEKTQQKLLKQNQALKNQNTSLKNQNQDLEQKLEERKFRRSAPNRTLKPVEKPEPPPWKT
jgi:hypothetical protein